MFWIFILVVGLATMVFKLGSYSAWITVLAIVLKLAILGIAILAAAFVWQRIKGKQNQS